MKSLLILLLLSGMAISTAPAQSTVFLVRHAEKAESSGKDPDLSGAGQTRAEALARMLKEAEITAIYATEFKRTQQTAAPLAKMLKIEVTIVPAKDSDALVARLHESKGNALVIGHGNTIPDVIKGLGLNTPVSIAESDYDNLFLVALEGKPRLLRLHFP